MQLCVQFSYRCTESYVAGILFLLVFASHTSSIKHYEEFLLITWQIVKLAQGEEELKSIALLRDGYVEK